jgi:hypothetical protein
MKRRLAIASFPHIKHAAALVYAGSGAKLIKRMFLSREWLSSFYGDSTVVQTVAMVTVFLVGDPTWN